MIGGAGTMGAAALETMRAQLRPHHDSIERSLDFMGGDIDRRRYIRFLEKTYGFIAACERRLDIAGAPPLLDIQRRLKTGALRANLRALGSDPEEIDSAPVCWQVPHVTQWPAALGYFYVIEGSTLGGQLLARHFRARLGVTDEELGFLLGYRAETGVMWKQMIGVLEAAMSNAAAAEQITDSARDTFTLLERWHQAR